MADLDDGKVMEGYICPNCMKMFNSPDLLLKHFANEHSSETDILKALQGLFGKAKKKILSLDESPDGSSSSGSVYNKKYTVDYYEQYWPLQELGTSRSHTLMFKTLRDDRFERFSHEINKLIIRLDKLLTNMPLDPIKKKNHEQSIVPWLDGKDVPRCPNCTRSFNPITKRQHHCRLCGCIMCHECSFFLPLNKAKQILVDPDADELKLSASINSDLKLRVCSYCLQLLESREMLKESRSARVPLSDLYDTLVGKKQEASKLSAMYLQMVDSLLAGETTYYSTDAQALRVKLVRLAENIDTISNKISALSASTPAAPSDSPPPPMSMAQRLHKSIRLSSTQFIRANLLSLPNIPSDERLAELREEKRLADEQRQREEAIRELRQREESVVNVETHHARHSVSKENNVALLEAWSPANTKAVSSHDPLVQQISNIKQFIKEARMAHRYNEVASLERNLKELQEEYFRRQQEKPSEVNIS